MAINLTELTFVDPRGAMSSTAARFDYDQAQSRGANNANANLAYIPFTVVEGEDLDGTFELQIDQSASTIDVPVMLAFSDAIDTFDVLSVAPHNFWCLRNSIPVQPANPRYKLEIYSSDSGGATEDEDESLLLFGGLGAPINTHGGVYYAHLLLDADGGVNGTGRLTIAFYSDPDLAIGNLIDTLSVDAAVGHTLASFVQYLYVYNMWDVGWDQVGDTWSTGYLKDLNFGGGGPWYQQHQHV